MTTLADLREDERAVILGIDGVDTVSLRMMEMGLTDGQTVQLISKAPMGDPLEFLVRGYRLSLRKDEASRVRADRIAP